MILRRDRLKGWILNKDLKYITFIFDEKLYKFKNCSQIFIQGSFNNWEKGTSGFWKMNKGKHGLWFLKTEITRILIPGNSGFAEFKFFIEDKNNFFEPDSICRIPGTVMSGNNVISFSKKDTEYIAKNSLIADRIKTLSDFDLNNNKDRMIISNIRKVPGTKSLYRGYHPFKMSKEFETESKRIQIVKEYFEDLKIKSVITLCGKEFPSEREEISEYEKHIMNNENWYWTDTDYNTVYFNSDSKDFFEFISGIIKFIATHPSPYYIHCRLGTDRTGTCSAILAALCGANWEEICCDYQKSNETGFKEFRDWRLLQYSFEKILKKTISDGTDLQKEISTRLIETGAITKETLIKAVQNLKS